MVVAKSRLRLRVSPTMEIGVGKFCLDEMVELVDEEFAISLIA